MAWKQNTTLMVRNVSEENDNVIKGYNMKNQRKTGIQKMMKVVFGVCAIALCVHFTTFDAQAYTKTTGTVIPATAKIRAEANTSSEAVGSTAAGKTVSIVDEVTGSDGSTWYQIEVEGSTKGYIRADLVTKAASSGSTADTSASTGTDTSSATPASSAASLKQVDSQAATVSTASANVRKSASTTAEVVSSIAKGTSVTITGETTGDDGKRWYQISYNNGATGFIRADLVTAGEAAETEVTGTKNSDTAGTEKQESSEADTQEASTEEATTESAGAEAATEASGEETEGTTSGTGTVTILNTEETPALPSGFQEVSVTLNDQNVRAWKNGDFYIFYAQAADGTEGFYMYDSVEKTYQRYFMTNIEMPEGNDTTDLSGFLKPIVIGMAAVLVILLIIIIILTVKLNEYKEEIGWDPDEEDDYPEDEIEEEEEELPRQYKKKKRKVRPVIEEDDMMEEEEEPEPVVRRVPKKKVETARPQAKKVTASKPRNFLEEEEMEIPVKKKIKKKPAFTPVSDDLDPDDEDTFVFINLDGDDLD